MRWNRPVRPRALHRIRCGSIPLLRIVRAASASWQNSSQRAGPPRSPFEAVEWLIPQISSIQSRCGCCLSGVSKSKTKFGCDRRCAHFLGPWRAWLWRRASGAPGVGIFCRQRRVAAVAAAAAPEAEGGGSRSTTEDTMIRWTLSGLINTLIVLLAHSSRCLDLIYYGIDHSLSIQWRAAKKCWSREWHQQDPRVALS